MLLAELILHVTAKYKTDPTEAGVVISYLWKTRQWYISIVRYKEKYGKGKYVVCNTVSHFFTWAVIKLWLKWRAL